MGREHHSEVVVDGTAWTVSGSAVDDRVRVEVVAAAEADGVVGLQLTLDGDGTHLAMLEDIAHELQSVLCGVPRRRRRPGAYRVATIRRELPRAYEPWTADEERRLLERHHAGQRAAEIAAALDRGSGGVRSRLVRLGRLPEAAEPEATAS